MPLASYPSCDLQWTFTENSATVPGNFLKYSLWVLVTFVARTQVICVQDTPGTLALSTISSGRSSSQWAPRLGSVWPPRTPFSIRSVYFCFKFVNNSVMGVMSIEFEIFEYFKSFWSGSGSITLVLRNRHNEKNLIVSTECGSGSHRIHLYLPDPTKSLTILNKKKVLTVGLKK